MKHKTISAADLAAFINKKKAAAPLMPEAKAAVTPSQRIEEPVVRTVKQRAPIPAGLADVALIDARECAAAAGMGLSQWFDLVRTGMAPAPMIRSPRFSRWRIVDVRDWLINRMNAAAEDNETANSVMDRAKKASQASKAKRVGAAGLGDPHSKE